MLRCAVPSFAVLPGVLVYSYGVGLRVTESIHVFMKCYVPSKFCASVCVSPNNKISISNITLDWATYLAFILFQYNPCIYTLHS